MNIVCEHGRLKRECKFCEKDAEIARLHSEIEALQACRIPTEPTTEMVQAGVSFALRTSVGDSWHRYISDLYRHMIRHAPNQPQMRSTPALRSGDGHDSNDF
ncbi:hypothetical protein BI364_09950 [Acidihalobacter yilgarnensis]|uniref:Uncharacterized protein n=1 Tax=Acidihalobacter yilgarnensis TaxID=2819280 RepID=A0A1D8IP41_9GAMM|nr:hypothetical protein BI364_09950 [Acidihalobacter yilgarnensis]